jgi:glutathione S-transferase
VAGQHYGITKESYFLKMNPNGRIPVIDDNGYILYESNAIIRYLWAKAFPSALEFKNLQSWSNQDKWMEWTSATLYYPSFREFYLYFARTPENQLSSIKTSQLYSLVLPLLKIVNDQLGQTPYIAGEKMSMADIPLGVLIDKWERIDQKKSNLLNLSLYYDRLLEHKYFFNCVVKHALDAV